MAAGLMIQFDVVLSGMDLSCVMWMQFRHLISLAWCGIEMK